MAFLAQQVFGRNFAVFEDQLRRVAGPQTQFVFLLAGAESLGAFLHHERRQSMGTRRFVCHRNHNRRVSVMAIGDERLGTVQHPVVAATHRGATRAAGVRAGARFRQAPRAEELTGGELGNILPLLLFVTGNEDVIRAQRSVCGHNDAYGPVHARQFFDGGDILDVAHAGAAVLGGKNGAHQAQLAQLFDSLQRESTGFVPLHHVGRNLALREVAHHFL